MAHFIITNARGVIQELYLQPGLNRIGRTEDNDQVLPDPSVSRHHCEIVVSDTEITLKDLGSSNGTYVDERPVQEAVLRDGQRVRLGSILMILNAPPPPRMAHAAALEAAPAPAVPVAENPPAPPPGQSALASPVPLEEAPATVESPLATTTHCPNHPEAAVAFVCQKCGQFWCKACVKSRRLGVKTFYSCAYCDGPCISRSEHQNLEAQKEKQTASFFRLIPGTFSYPFKQGGFAIVLIGAFFLSLADWARALATFAPFYGLSAILILFVISVGYTFSYVKSVALDTVNGKDVLPGWPEFSSFVDDLIVPCFQFVVVFVVCLGPGLTVLYQGFPPPVGMAVLLVGLFCLPMAFLTVSLADGIRGLNPIIIFSGIAKVPGAYLAACGVFLLFVAVGSGVDYLQEHLKLPLVPTVVGKFIYLYGLIVEMRIMGLFYYRYRERLAWFG